MGRAQCSLVPKRFICATLVVVMSLLHGYLLNNAAGYQDSSFSDSREELSGNFDKRDVTAAKANLLNLAPEDRLEWIDLLSQARGTDGAATSDELLAGNTGGGALPNFGQLIQLIENTIDGNWASEGGTSNIMPYQNGVRVDPNGVISRITNAEIDETTRIRKLRPAMNWKKLGEWQSPADLRWISLGKLDELVGNSKSSNIPVKTSAIVMGGLCRIDYLAWDDASQSWLLGGPAGDLVLNDDGELVHRTLLLPPVLIEDLINVGSTVLYGDGVFGCSIDPDEKRLQEAFQFSQSIESMNLFRSRPKSWVEAWRNKLGHQNARVGGIPAQTTTALALLVADAEMKRMALEFDPLPRGVRSYWQETDLLGRAPQSPIIRWWFTLGNAKIPFDKERQIYRIPANNLSVLTESQFYNLQGTRTATLAPDIAADAFAKNFTQNSSAIQRSSVAQGRLKHITDLAVAFEIIRLEQEANRRGLLSELIRAQVPASLPHQPALIESIATSHVMPNGTRVAIASGGITIDVRKTSQRFTWGNTELSKVVIPKFTNIDGDEAQELTSEFQFWHDVKAAAIDNAPAPSPNRDKKNPLPTPQD